MAKQVSAQLPQDEREAALMRAMSDFVDAEWYCARYPDVAAAHLDPLLHFIRHGIAEQRDPNRFFDGAWYTGHYPDVGNRGLHPLLHYLQFGAAALRDPHPHFDAAWYAGQHPDAAANPLLYHIRTGLELGYPAEKTIDVHDYLPVEGLPRPCARKVIADVVIPVYRGLNETRRCLTSVLVAAGRPLGRIIVVDDCSPEPGLSAWLDELAAKRLIHLIRNPCNTGFVASANRGMQAAGNHDVVLLNSDTEVPPGWLGRLAAQAYAHPRIASVSPFSNNATICGYPNNNRNPIAFGRSMLQVDAVCQSVNAGRWVDVPTTVGFCMYIRRAALNQVGPFDAARFGLGYGEENDFCLRATGLGWRHRLACDTFVYHAGAVSFGNRTNKLAVQAMRLILERYPTYTQDIARHVSLNQVAPYRFAVTAALIRQSKLPVILMVTHDLGGGVQRHIESLITRFTGSAHFLLLQATDRGSTLSVPSVPGHSTLTLPAERMDDLILILQSMHPTRVHIHHLLGSAMDIQTLIHRLRLPFDVTVHDYLAICPQINLLPWRHSLYCQEPDIAGCNTCIARRPSHGARDIVTWRAERAWQFKQADRVLCPSHDVLSRLQRHGLAENAIYAPHEGVQPAPWPLRIQPLRNSKLRVAVLGTLVDHKGGRTVASVAEMIDPTTTELHLIGHTDGQFAELALKRMRITGRYNDADLPRLIETIAPHVIWFPAVWPESFSYTLSAAIEAGAAIAATRIGAHTERLAGRPFTWMADIATSPQAWIKLFNQIGAALQSATIPDNPPMRPAVADYYETQYLQPRPRPRTTGAAVRPHRPCITVVPERFTAGYATPCAYIRLLQPLYHPSVCRDFNVRLADPVTVFHQPADIIVTQRSAMPDPATAGRLAAHARAIGAKLVYDLDDDLLDVPRTHPDAMTLRPRARIVRHMLDMADTVCLATPGLAKRLATIRPDAIVLPNALDEHIWTAPAPPSRDQPVRILCMGTTTHGGDFALIEPALLRLKAEYQDRILIDIIGMTSHDHLPLGLNRINPPPNAMRSYPGFVQWVTTRTPGWHIGLAPLLDTAFNRCKSPIKAMDYAALGMVVIASDITVYQGSVADGPAGQLVPNSHPAWYAALNWLLRNRNARQATAARARDAFLATASLASQAHTRHSTWSRLLAPRAGNAAA